MLEISPWQSQWVWDCGSHPEIGMLLPLSKGKMACPSHGEPMWHCVRGTRLAWNYPHTVLPAVLPSFSDLSGPKCLDSRMAVVPSHPFCLPSLVSFTFSFSSPLLLHVFQVGWWDDGLMVTQFFHAALHGGGIKENALPSIYVAN